MYERGLISAASRIHAIRESLGAGSKIYPSAAEIGDSNSFTSVLVFTPGLTNVISALPKMKGKLRIHASGKYSETQEKFIFHFSLQ